MKSYESLNNFLLRVAQVLKHIKSLISSWQDYNNHQLLCSPNEFNILKILTSEPFQKHQLYPKKREFVKAEHQKYEREYVRFGKTWARFYL